MDPSTINVTPAQFASLLDQVVENRDRQPPLYLVSKKESDGSVLIGMCDLKAATENGYQKMPLAEINALAQGFIEQISKLEEKRRRQLLPNADKAADDIEQLKLQQMLNSAKDITIGLTKLGELRIKKIDLAKQKANSWKTFTIQVFSTLSIVGLPIAYYISRTKTTLTEQYQNALNSVIKERIGRMVQSSYDLMLNLRQLALDKNEETCPRILERLNTALKQAGEALILETFAKSTEEDQKFTIESPAKHFRNKYASLTEKLAQTKEADSSQFREGFVKEQVLEILAAVSDDSQALKWLTAIQAVCSQRNEQRLRHPDDVQALRTLFSLQQMADESFFTFQSNLGTHSIVISEKEGYKVTVREAPETLRIQSVKIEMLSTLLLRERVETEEETLFVDTKKKIYYLSSFSLAFAEGAFSVSNLVREFLTKEELIRRRAIELIEAWKLKTLEKSSLVAAVISKGVEIELQNIQKKLFFNSFEHDLKKGLPFRIYDTGSLFQNAYPTFAAKLEQTQEEDSSSSRNRFVEEQVEAIRQATANDPRAESWLNAIRAVCQYKQLVDIERFKELVDQEQIEMLRDEELKSEGAVYRLVTKEEPLFVVKVNREPATTIIQDVLVEVECGMRILEQVTQEGYETMETDIAKVNYTCSFKLTFNGEAFEVIELKSAFT